MLGSIKMYRKITEDNRSVQEKNDVYAWYTGLYECVYSQPSIKDIRIRTCR
jgi:hypothetical protein